MKRVQILSWEDLDALPGGQWVEVVGGVDVEFVKARRDMRERGLVIPLGSKVARSLAPRSGEILEAKVRGNDLVGVLRRARARQPARAHRVRA